jgi:nickel/cobalt exporter
MRSPSRDRAPIRTPDARLWYHPRVIGADLRPDRVRGRRRAGPRVLRALAAAVVLLPFAATAVLAHPLGNFTINHHAGIRVEPDRVLLDIVIDQAEIPTFQAVMDLDEDGDGEFSDDELLAAETTGCTSVGQALSLTIGGAQAPLRVIEAGVTFPPGNGGLSTMRLVCTLESPLAAALDAPTTIVFEDRFEPSRIGWREMTVTGSAVTISDTDLPAESATARLTTYPEALASAPDVRTATFTVTPGGPTLAPFDVPDADPIPPIQFGETVVGAPPGPVAIVSGACPSAGVAGGAAGDLCPKGMNRPAEPPAKAEAPALPGGEGAIPDVLRTVPVTPILALLAFATAAFLGAGHALTPGHGKTLMAAYLVGTRGTPRHALGLGAAVSVSHTIGILGLALVVVAAERALPPDLVVRAAPIIAAVTILAIGGWMLLTEVRRWLAARRPGTTAARADHDHAHPGHGHDHPLPHDHGHDHETAHAHAPADAHVTADDGLEHSHGGVTHRHVPAAGATITWRSLFVLGLAGGLIPSTNALLILLTTIAAGQPAWGIVLVGAFGLGMAAVMAGVGLAFVYARGALERGAARAGVGRVTRLVPLAASVLVLAVGVALTTQAVGAARIV